MLCSFRTTEPISIHKSEQDGSQPDIRFVRIVP